MKKICVMHRASIGDTLLATPAYRAIKTVYPNAKLVVITSRLGNELLYGNPYIDKLVAYEKGDSVISVLREIWRADVALIFAHHYRNALYAFLALIPKRIGRGKDFINCRLSDKNELKYEPLKYLNITQQIGVNTSDLSLHRPMPSEDEQKRVRQLIDNFRDNPEQKVVIIVPYSLASKKDWAAENYRKIIHRLKGKEILPVVLGGKDNREQIANEFPEAINMAGETNLRESAELIALADLQLCGCTAMLHVCSTTDTPVIAMYGPTDPEQWAPRGNCTVISHKFSCSPCYNNGSKPCDDNKCIQAITVDEVWKEMEKYLDEEK